MQSLQRKLVATELKKTLFSQQIIPFQSATPLDESLIRPRKTDPRLVATLERLHQEYTLLTEETDTARWLTNPTVRSRPIERRGEELVSRTREYAFQKLVSQYFPMEEQGLYVEGGAGFGGSTRRLAEHQRRQLTLLEINDMGVAELTRQFPEVRKVVHDSMYHPPFERASVDGWLGFSALDSPLLLWKVCQAIFQVLKPGGTFLHIQDATPYAEQVPAWNKHYPEHPRYYRPAIYATPEQIEGLSKARNVEVFLKMLGNNIPFRGYVERDREWIEPIDDFHERLVFHLEEAGFTILQSGIFHTSFIGQANEAQRQLQQTKGRDYPRSRNHFIVENGFLRYSEDEQLTPGMVKEEVSVHFIQARKNLKK